MRLTLWLLLGSLALAALLYVVTDGRVIFLPLILLLPLGLFAFRRR